MNINHLKAFVTVVQVQSFQKAAKRLNVSQPAITLRIQAIEEKFQTKIIHRSHDSITLTPQGELLYKESIEILKKWEKLENIYLSGEPKGKLSLGASTIPSEYLLPNILKDFRAKYPDVKFQMKVSGTKDVIQWLFDRNVDVIITGTPEKDKNKKSIPIYDDELKIIAPYDEESTNKTTFTDFLDRNWIMRNEDSNTRQTFEKGLKEMKLSMDDLNVIAQMGSTDAVVAAVEAGLGISVVSSLAAARAEKYKRVKVLHVKDFYIPRKFYLSYLDDNKNSPIISAFSSFVQNYHFENLC